MKKLFTKMGNAVVCQENDVVAAQNLVKLLDLFESDRNNEFNFYNSTEEKFEIELKFHDFGGKVLSCVQSEIKYDLMAQNIKTYFTKLKEIESEVLYKYNHSTRADQKLLDPEVDAVQDQIVDIRDKYSRPAEIKLDFSMKFILENFDEIFGYMAVGEDFGQLEVVLHEICHIYTASIYKPHGPEFKANCQVLAKTVSENIWPVNGTRFGRATYKTALYIDLDTLVGAAE